MAVNEQLPRSEQLAAQIAGRFPPESLLTVRVAHERSDPESTEPRPPALDVRLIPRGPEEYNAFATEVPGRGHVPSTV
jgi:hypothetical protein